MRGSLERRVWTYDPELYAPPRHRGACSYDAFVPEPLAGINPQLPAELAGVIAEAEAEVHALNAVARESRALDPLMHLLLRTESIASSRIEGLQVDARTVARAEVAHDLGERVGRVVDEVLGNVEAMAFAIEEASTPAAMSVADLVEIHRVLMARSVDSRFAGRVRDRQNWIGGNDYNPCGADFVPPPPEHVPGLLDDLCGYVADELVSPVVQAALAHAQFETIHPFADGNGRAGRALIHVILRRRGIASHFVPPISVALASRRDRYIEGLTAFREDRIVDWLEVFAVATADAARLSRRCVDEVNAQQEGWRENVRTLRRVRADSVVWPIIDLLPGHPVLSVPIAVALTRRSKPAVNNAVAALVEAGVLVPLRESARNRAWEAAGLLDLVAALEERPA